MTSIAERPRRRLPPQADLINFPDPPGDIKNPDGMESLIHKIDFSVADSLVWESEEFRDHVEAYIKIDPEQEFFNARDVKRATGRSDSYRSEAFKAGMQEAYDKYGGRVVGGKNSRSIEVVLEGFFEVASKLGPPLPDRVLRGKKGAAQRFGDPTILYHSRGESETRGRRKLPPDTYIAKVDDFIAQNPKPFRTMKDIDEATGYTMGRAKREDVRSVLIKDGIKGVHPHIPDETFRKVCLVVGPVKENNYNGRIRHLDMGRRKKKDVVKGDVLILQTEQQVFPDTKPVEEEVIAHRVEESEIKAGDPIVLFKAESEYLSAVVATHAPEDDVPIGNNETATPISKEEMGTFASVVRVVYLAHGSFDRPLRRFGVTLTPEYFAMLGGLMGSVVAHDLDETIAVFDALLERAEDILVIRDSNNIIEGDQISVVFEPFTHFEKSAFLREALRDIRNDYVQIKRPQYSKKRSYE